MERDAVRALYDYTATIPEEFDFRENDIIAVTSTREDGWWSGELLDEKRRVPGRIFPGNFVCLFWGLTSPQPQQRADPPKKITEHGRGVLFYGAATF